MIFTLFIVILLLLVVAVVLVILGVAFAHPIYLMLLNLLDDLSQIFDIMAGVSPVEYAGKSMSLFDVFFQQSAIGAVFWGITLIGLALAVIFSIIEVARRAADLRAEKSMYATLGRIGRSMLMFIVTPLMFLAILSLSASVMKKTDEIFYTATASPTLANAIFALSAREAALEDAAVIDDFAQGRLRFDMESDVRANIDVSAINLWLGIPVALFIIAVYVACLIVLVWRLFVLIVLYLISPFFVASMVLDDGVKYKAWRDAFFSKLLSGFALIISVKIFAFLFVPLITGNIALTDNILGDIALKCMLIAGSAYAMYKSTNMLVTIIAPNAESDEAALMNMTVGAVVGKLRRMPAWALNKAIEVAKKGVEIAIETAILIGKIAAAVPSGGATAAAIVPQVAKVLGKETAKTGAKVGLKTAEQAVSKTAAATKDAAGSMAQSADKSEK